MRMLDGTEIDVWPVLGCVEGDMPWLEKIIHSLGHAAKRACFKCALNGVWIPEANAVRYGSCCQLQVAALKFAQMKLRETAC